MNMPIVEIVKSGARNQANTLVSFLTTPVGPFETVDRMVKNARSTARQVFQQTGVRAPGVLQRFRLMR